MPKVIRISSLLTCLAPRPRAKPEPESQDPKALRRRSGLFHFPFSSISPRTRIRSDLPSLRKRASFGSVGCTIHHHFGARFSMTRKFCSSIPTSALATCARASCEVAASRSMRLTASTRRGLCGAQALRPDIACCSWTSPWRGSRLLCRDQAREPRRARCLSRRPSDLPVVDLADRGHGYRKGTSTMGGDGEALRHRGLKNLSLRQETAKLWWWCVMPDKSKFRTCCYQIPAAPVPA